MTHRTGTATAAAAAAAAAASLLAVCAPAFAGTASSVTLKDPHGDAITSTGEAGAAKLNIYKITGAKAGTALRLTMTVRKLPADIASADPTGNHRVMGVATRNSGSGFEPTATGKVRVAGGNVCKG